MDWIILLLIAFIIIYLLQDFYDKKKEEKLKKLLDKKWGKPKSDEYFNFDLISKYFSRSTRNTSKAFHLISERVCNDLDLNKVFEFIDRTSSRIGQQYLYAKIRTPENDQDSLKRFDQLTESYSSDEDARRSCQLALSKLNSTNVFYFEDLIHGEQIKKPKWLNLVYILTILSAVIIISSFFKPVAILFLLPVYSLNMFFHYKNKQIIQYYLLAVSQLLKILKVTKKMSKYKINKEHFGKLTFLKKISSLKWKAKFISLERQMEGEAAQLAWLITELLKITFNIEIIVFYSFIDKITKEKERLSELMNYIGEIDAAISNASLRHGLTHYCKPEFADEKILQFDDMVHPLIPNCIPNSLDLNNKSMLLTGSNMAGKTTFIRTVAINALLAQTIYSCFAKRYIAPILKIHSSIRISDDVLENTSYYLQEVLIIKEQLKASEEEGCCLFILDELFKGTNTAERISGGKAILSYLNKKNHFVMVSTHDTEMTDLLINENYDNYHFKEHIENNKLIFDHKLKKGVLKTRNAIKILELYDYDYQIIEDANNTLKKFESQLEKK